jgi:two-component system chemotaxis response regulator CheY
VKRINKVLLVDDSEFMRKKLKVILENNNYIVVGEACNGNDAIMRFLETSPDIVILKIIMPQIDGMNVLKEINRIKPDSKVLVLSGPWHDNVLDEAMSTGAKGVVFKPFKEQQVINALNNI